MKKNNIAKEYVNVQSLSTLCVADFHVNSNEAICRLSKLGGGLTPLDFPIQIVFSLSRGMKLYQVLP